MLIKAEIRNAHAKLILGCSRRLLIMIGPESQLSKGRSLHSAPPRETPEEYIPSARARLRAKYPCMQANITMYL